MNPMIVYCRLSLYQCLHTTTSTSLFGTCREPWKPMNSDSSILASQRVFNAVYMPSLAPVTIGRPCSLIDL
jgi:hypothetical protein